MTRTVDYAVNSYEINLGQTKLDLTGTRDPDDLQNGANFFVQLNVAEKPGFRNRFRDHWKQVVRFTIYFTPDDELTKPERGRVKREWDDNGRVLAGAYTRVREGGFGPMQDWLNAKSVLTLSLIGEDSNADTARFRLEGNATAI